MRIERHVRASSLGALSLCLALTTSVARGQSEPPTAGSATAPDPEAIPGADANPDPVSDPDPVAVSSAAAAPAGPSRQALLQAAVDDAERDQPNLVLPWLAAGVGVTTLLAGTVVGVINVASCEGSCSTDAVWPWLVIAGCTFTSAGGAWLIVALHDQSEARHRLSRAREELERDRIDRGQPQAAAAPRFTLRASF